MSNIIPIEQGWPPVGAGITRGHELALEMFRLLDGHHVDPENAECDDGPYRGDECELDPESRRGRAYVNIVQIYLERARDAGPDVERGFTMILSDLAAQNMGGGCGIDIEYYEALLQRGIR